MSQQCQTKNAQRFKVSHQGLQQPKAASCRAFQSCSLTCWRLTDSSREHACVCHVCQVHTIAKNLALHLHICKTKHRIRQLPSEDCNPQVVTCAAMRYHLGCQDRPSGHEGTLAPTGLPKTEAAGFHPLRRPQIALVDTNHSLRILHPGGGLQGSSVQSMR